MAMASLLLSLMHLRMINLLSLGISTDRKSDTQAFIEFNEVLCLPVAPYFLIVIESSSSFKHQLTNYNSKY